MIDPNLPLLSAIADGLGELNGRVVYVGGCATGLLITLPRAQSLRPTLDVDVVVEAVSVNDYHDMERAVEARGFAHDISPDAPICRWRWQGMMLDLMPSHPRTLGFGNPWYPRVVEKPVRTQLPNGREIRLIRAELFVATKLTAFRDRGNGDFTASHDLEDLLTVIDGRPELVDELREADREVRQFVSEQIAELLAQPEFLNALPGHLPADSASQARLPELIERLRAIAELQPH